MTTPNRYNQGKIYKITNNCDDMIYIGSTCMPLSKRFYNHKAESAAKRNPNRRLFVHANQVGWAECQIVLVENFSCNSSDELRQREEYHRHRVPPEQCLNAQRCFTTREDINNDRRVQRANDPEYRKLCNKRSNQWAKDHPEYVRETQRQFYYDNREKRCAQRRASYHRHRDVERVRRRLQREYLMSWGGDPSRHNNLVRIDLSIFQ